MIKYTIAEELFITPVREVFSEDYFGYSVVHEAKCATGYEICFTIDYAKQPSLFSSDIKKHGIKIDMDMLNFRIKDHTQSGSNIELVIPATSRKSGRRLVVPFDNSATALLLESCKTNSIHKINDYFIGLIQNAIALS